MKGLLLTMTEPAPGDAEEFNRWYDEERVPLAPGWRAARDATWARRIDRLTGDCEWILRTYRAYAPA